MTLEGAGTVTLLEEVREELGRLERELSELEVLAQQVRVEAGRHEQKRGATAERVAVLESGRPDPRELHDAYAQLVTVTRRAAMMQAQIDVLEGKQRALQRFRERLAAVADTLASPGGGQGGQGVQADLPPELSRAVLTAQEDLRREIARQMHDGPAQSLTNIALQAQIVQRLVDRDTTMARQELLLLVDMVQRTLEATKTFIFNVRPMVLDDLGLVPTLRRAARDRGRQATVRVDFDSNGADRRLGAELESGMFRIIDDALAGFLRTDPESVSLRLDWTDTALRARIARHARADEEHAVPDIPFESDAGAATAIPPSAAAGLRWRRPRRDEEPEAEPAEVPAALAAMIAEERADRAADVAATATSVAAARALPMESWDEIRSRAGVLDVAVELSDDGQVVEAALALEG
jgi:two-component system sensor histidine kinase DegS